MAVEAHRGCGYRKVGGLYLVGDGTGIPCDRLPLPLDLCPTCGHGIKPTRGFTWVDVLPLVGGNHVQRRLVEVDDPGDYKEIGTHYKSFTVPCFDPPSCPLCHNTASMGRAGLLWIGAQFYPIVEDFEDEARSQGISRRISTIPHGFKLGETWMLFAHAKAVRKMVVPEGGLGIATEAKYSAGIFRVWKPERIERLFKESDRGSEAVAADEKRGITPVFVPDDDPDHRNGDDDA